MTNWQSLAQAGVQEELAANKAQRRKDNIRNCNKPFWFYDPLTKQPRCILPTCKDWTCEHCNQVRAGEEKARIELALEQYETVYVVFDITAKDWQRLSKAFKVANIVKEMYRRLPQDSGLVTVFFVGELRSSPMMKTEIFKSRLDDSLKSDDLENPWYNLARKRPGRRTSGSLGAPPPDELDGPELTSVRIVTVRGEAVTSEDRIQAQDQANSTVAAIDPQDKEHLESIIEQWADTYEATLRQLGYHTYRLRAWRKMDLTSIHLSQDHIEDKSPAPYSLSLELAQEHPCPRQTVEI